MCNNANQRANQVSIPNGTIKSPVPKRQSPGYNPFQFQMVRLKVQLPQTGLSGFLWFQFQMVRLKALYAAVTRSFA